MIEPINSKRIPRIAEDSPSIRLSGLNKVKKVKYFACSALSPVFANAWRTYISAGIPAPMERLYFVSLNTHEAKKQIPPINRCRQSNPRLRRRSLGISSASGNCVAQVISRILTNVMSMKMQVTRTFICVKAIVLLFTGAATSATIELLSTYFATRELLRKTKNTMGMTKRIKPYK